ncbi:hypothetical protein TNCV_2862911 [Trichonephila clavipes]|nr:hypothetical protein TNCV_2862911 [Trichonephila clavipes]
MAVGQRIVTSQKLWSLLFCHGCRVHPTWYSSKTIPGRMLHRERLTDLHGRDMNREPLAMDDLRTAVDVDWQRLPQATINGLIDRTPRRIEACTVA